MGEYGGLYYWRRRLERPRGQGNRRTLSGRASRRWSHLDPPVYIISDSAYKTTGMRENDFTARDQVKRPRRPQDNPAAGAGERRRR